jgi:hypothetical protein
MTASAIKIGMLVRIYNQEHIWHNEIGIVRVVGPIFSRIELLGKLTHIPNHWLVEVDEGQPNVKGNIK